MKWRNLTHIHSDTGITIRLPKSYHTSDLELGSLVAVLLGVWHSKVIDRTGWPGVCVLLLHEGVSLI